jgi:hypothetical protein
MLLRQTKQPPRRSPSVAELVDTCVTAVTSAALGNAISSPYVCAEQDKCASDSEIHDFWWKRLGWNPRWTPLRGAWIAACVAW